MQRRTLFGLVGGGLALAAISLLLGLKANPLPQASVAGAGTAVAAEPELSETVARQLADDVHSGNPERAASAIALPAGQSLPAETVKQLHTLRMLKLIPGSLHDNGDGTATAEFTQVDAAGTSSRWQVTLIQANQHWQIDLTSQE